MNKMGAWLVNFMRGRYGFDSLGQALSVGVVVLWIFSILFGVFARILGSWAAWASNVLNWIGLILLIAMLFRMLSRNVEKRRAENDAYLERKLRRSQRKRSSSKDASAKKSKNTNKNTNKNKNKNANKNASAPADAPQYTYLNCGFCGQKMRVPAGKGKVAVKCPSCGEKTIVKS